MAQNKSRIPESFGLEEKVVHPYRALIITVAIITGASLFAAGMFYQSKFKTVIDDFEPFVDIATGKPVRPLTDAEVRHIIYAPDSGAGAENQLTLTKNEVSSIVTGDRSKSLNRSLTNAEVKDLIK